MFLRVKKLAENNNKRRLQFLTFADRWQPIPLRRVPRDTVENRLTKQLVAAHTGVVEGFPSLEMELGGAGNPVLGGPRVTAGLKRLCCYEEGNNKTLTTLHSNVIRFRLLAELKSLWI